MFRDIILIVLLLIYSLIGTASELALFIDDPKVLVKLEKSGFQFQNWFSISDFNLNNFELYSKSKAYKSIVDSISGDLDLISKNDSLSSVTMAKSHRLFNKKWLTAKSAHYELVGIINRMDRMDFHPNTCGELRFIYRLAYNITKSKQSIYSRLPLTFNVVVFLPEGDCSSIAKNWKEIKKPKDQKIKAIELNLQATRWPSTVRPDFGGYAEYFLRVFKQKANGYVLSALENTPDVPALIKNKKLHAELLKWMRQSENLKQLDNGTIIIPEKYLAKKATSVALNGRSRKFNHPFSQIYSENDFKDLNLKAFKTFKTPYALLKRVNDMSCVGCHQGRTVAGFHFLGKDRDGVSPVNSILSSFSAHFFNDQKRRENYWSAIKRKQQADSFRSFSVRSRDEKGTWGSHCSMRRDISFNDWTCEEGLKCESYDLSKNNPLGTCVEKSNASEGSHCKVGIYKANDNPKKDRIIQATELSCREDLYCEDTSVGFPGGMCSGDCTKLGKNATCGSIAILFGFNQCLSQAKPFEKCLVDNVRPGSLRSCGATQHCRDDYICAKTASGAGGCIPPYFLFQLRVDGHPKPI